MPCFIKIEAFKKSTFALSEQQREVYLSAHRSWVKELIASGVKVSSGYLKDAQQRPGGGGLLIIEADSFLQAKRIIEKDPMILASLVTWNLHEWKQVSGLNLFP